MIHGAVTASGEEKMKDLVHLIIAQRAQAASKITCTH